MPASDKDCESPTSQLEWERQTNQLLSGAKSAQLQSTRRRTSAFDTQSRTGDAQEFTSRLSHNALDEKIRESVLLAQKATDEVSEILTEESALHERMAAATSMIDQLQDPIQCAEKALELRRGRPEPENTMDAAERALKEQIAAGKHLIRMMGAVLEGGHKETANLQACRHALEQDIATKKVSTEVDRQALAMQAGAHGDPNGIMGRTRPSAGHPLQWRLHTDNLIHAGKRTRASVSRLKDRADALVREGVSVEKSTREGVIKALTAKTKDNTKLKKEVEAALAAVTEEISSLKSSLKATRRTEVELDRPLSLATGRLSRRSERPPQELVLDDAETSLEREVQDLLYSRRKLVQQCDKQEGDLARLEATKADMERTIGEKEAALEIDGACL
eukprot:CAMPEP_0206245816 /NCGR_PEP_ID=MMETSP0047_2-20121206/18907_1 /ASSEMBLY_ACC=CAM_ASM_000192 /TAXON_ID=195065 /ORGANISM="Chroomonas mesostigmatica_cf, Strain CCMP1168" /LENGTH=390 /DNA_ID=CAMNT_0053671157 /DNA_START=25 /DNA_END=1193 /DNA_ORIENTATION=+